MSDEKGMGIISLIICIAVIVLLIIGIILFTRKEAREEKVELYVTDMLVLQGKVKVIASTNAIKDEDLLKGRKVEECMEEGNIQKLLQNGVISEDEENFSDYYIIDKETLNEMEVLETDSNIDLNNEYFVVNYETGEIIYSKGVVVKGIFYYKLSELIQVSEELNKDEKTENTAQAQETTEEVSKEVAEKQADETDETAVEE